MMKTKYHLSIFLIALFAGLMGFTTDAAAKSYTIRVGGVQIESENAANITGPNITGKVSFDESTHTLILNNATIDGGTDSPIELFARGGGGEIIPSDGITIRLEGSNTLKCTINAGIKALASIRITGSGNLTIKSGDGAIMVGHAKKDLNLTIDGCTITAYKYIYVKGRLEIINSGVIVSNNKSEDFAYKVSEGITLSNSTITVPKGGQVKRIKTLDGMMYTVVDESGEIAPSVAIAPGTLEPGKLTLEPKELISGPDQNGQKVILSCNKPYHINDLDKPDWIGYSWKAVAYEKSQTLTIYFTNNPGAERTGTITFKTTEGNVKLKVTQRAASSTSPAKLTLDPKELTVEADRNYPKLKISCDEKFLFQGVSGLDWVLPNGNTGNYEKSHTFSLIVTKNTGAERTGEITIKTTAGNVKLKVTQRAASSTPSATLTLDPMALTMKYHRNEAEVTLACSDKAFSINQVVIDHLDWLSATGGSGLYKKHFIRITAQENPGAKRTGTVTFKTSEGEATLHVTQEAKSTAPPTLTLTPTTLTFAASGGASQSVAVKSSVEGWGVRLKDRTQDWLTVTPDAAAKTVTVAVKPNTGTKKRSAEVEVVSDAGLTRSFFVTQQGNRPPESVSGLSLNPEAMTMGGSSGVVGFTLKSDKPWIVTADADWLHPGSTRGNAGTTYFRLRFDQNTTGAVRTGKLTFTTTDGKATKTFTLTQRVGSAKPKPSTPPEGTYDYDLAVNPESITLSGEGGGSSIDVVTHRLWAGSTADDWITLEKAVGRGDGSFDFTLAPNPSKEMRHGKITVRTEHGMDELTIAIHQQGQTGDIVLPGGVKVSGLTLDPATLIVDGDIASTLISALITPDDAANKSLLWMSSNPAVASVSILGQKRSGVALLPQLRFAPDADDYALVTIAGKGKATITAATSDGSGIVARCEIEVLSTVGNTVPYAPAARIYATPGTLYLALPQATRVEIYTLLGIRLRTLDAPAGDTSVTLPRGLYVVKAGSAVQKVRIE